MKPASFSQTPSVVQGDTWEGLGTIRIWDRDSDTRTKIPPADAVGTAEIRFASTLQQPEADLVLTDGSGLVITNAANWTFEVPPQVISLPPGEYTHSFVTVDTASVKRTWWYGKLRVLAPVPAAL